MSFPLTSLMTLLIGLLVFATALGVGRARVRYGVKVPAVTGHELFERAYRVQMNTLENTVLFLPALWLYATGLGDKGAAVGGAIWLVGRIWYAIVYPQDPAKRGPAFSLAMAAFAGMWLGALWGVVRTLAH